MADIAYCRRFNGTSDYIQITPDDYNGSTLGPFTAAAICRRILDSAGYRAFWAVSGGTGGEVEVGLTDGELFGYFESTTVAGPLDTMDSTDGWNLIAVTKAGGSSVLRWHQYRYSDTTWVLNEDDDGSACADQAISGASAFLGAYNAGSERFEGDIAVVGVWKGTALSDGQLSGMTDTLASWQALSPTGLWLLDQSSVATPVTDLVGVGDQTAISGTTATAISDLAFDVTLGTAPALRTIRSGLRW